MNKIAVGLATFLLVGIVAVIAFPLLIDWQKHEPTLSRLIGEGLGLDADIAGDIKLALLPRPVFVLDNVSLRSPVTGKTIVTAKRIKGEPQFWGLVTGELKLDEIKLSGAKIDLRGEELPFDYPLLNWIQGGEAQLGTLSFSVQNVGLENSTLLWASTNQILHRLDNITLSLTAGQATSQSILSAEFTASKIAHRLELNVGPLVKSDSQRSVVSRHIEFELVDETKQQAMELSGALLLDRLDRSGLGSLSFEGAVNGNGVPSAFGLTEIDPELRFPASDIEYQSDVKIDHSGASFSGGKVGLKGAIFNTEAYLSYTGRPVVEASLKADRLGLEGLESEYKWHQIERWLDDLRYLFASNDWIDLRFTLAIEKMWLGDAPLGRVNAAINYLDGVVLDSELTINQSGRHDLRIDNLTFEPASRYWAAEWSLGSLNLAKALRPFWPVLSAAVPLGQMTDFHSEGRFRISNHDLLLEVTQGKFDSSELSGHLKKNLSTVGDIAAFVQIDRLDLDSFLPSDQDVAAMSPSYLSPLVSTVLKRMSQVPSSQLDFSVSEAVWLGQRLKSPRLLLAADSEGSAELSFISEDISGVEASVSVSSQNDSEGTHGLSGIAVSLRENSDSANLRPFVTSWMPSLGIAGSALWNLPISLGVSINRDAKGWRLDAESQGDKGNWSLTSRVDELMPIAGLDGDWRLENMKLSNFVDLETAGLDDKFSGKGSLVGAKLGDITVDGKLGFSDSDLKLNGAISVNEGEVQTLDLAYDLTSDQSQAASSLSSFLGGKQQLEISIAGQIKLTEDLKELTVEKNSRIGATDLEGAFSYRTAREENLSPAASIEFLADELNVSDLPALQERLARGTAWLELPDATFNLSVERFSIMNETIQDLKVEGTLSQSKVSGSSFVGEWLGGALQGRFLSDLSSSPHWNLSVSGVDQAFNNKLGPIELIGQGSFQAEFGGRGLTKTQVLSSLSGKFAFDAVPALFVESPEAVVSWLEDESELTLSDREAEIIADLMAESFANAVADVDGKISLSGTKARLTSFNLNQAGFSLKANGAHDFENRETEFSANVVTTKDKQIPEFSLQGAGKWPTPTLKFFGKRFLED